jgi:hypothetical protein
VYMGGVMNLANGSVSVTDRIEEVNVTTGTMMYVCICVICLP